MHVTGNARKNCRYCAQSSHYNTEIESYPLMEVNEVMAAAHDSVKNGADRVAIVTSGKKLLMKAILTECLI